MRTQRVKVLQSFILGPDLYASVGDEITLSFVDAVRERAAGCVVWLKPKADEGDPEVTGAPIETRDPQPQNRDPNPKRR